MGRGLNWKALLVVALLAAGFEQIAGADPAAKQPTIVAVFPVDQGDNDRLDKEVLRTVSTHLASQLGAVPGFSIVPEEAVRDQLRTEQAESFKPCYDEACQIEVGRELAAQKVLRTRISRVGDGCVMTGFLYDLTRAVTDGTTAVRTTCEAKDLLTAAERLIETITNPFATGSIVVRSATPGGEVLLDGRSTGLSPPAVLHNVPSGQHQVLLRVGDQVADAIVTVQVGATTTVELNPAAPSPTPAQADAEIRWLWIGAGGALLASGAVLDLAPSSAHNNSFDALDVVPVAFYALAAVAGYLGLAPVF